MDHPGDQAVVGEEELYGISEDTEGLAMTVNESSHFCKVTLLLNSIPAGVSAVTHL